MTEPVTIPRKMQPSAGEDFGALREKGLEYIRKLAGKIWTDHNVHDPGITALELLCYAVTDLSYRTGFAMKDLLSFSPDDLLADNKSFHTAAAILPNNPCTLNDLRKIIVDVDGVQNAWIDPVEGCHPAIYLDCEKLKLTMVNPASEVPAVKGPNFKTPGSRNSTGDQGIRDRYYLTDSLSPSPSLTPGTPQLYLRGMYRIHVLFEEQVLKDGSQHAQMIRRVRDRIHKYRNLCVDLCGIDLIQYEDIGLCVEIDVQPEADINLVLAAIWMKIDLFLNPPIRFYTLDELLDKGTSPEEIFEGPVLDHGFIHEEEIELSQRTRRIYTSDLYNIIMDFPEVISVKKLEITNFDANGDPLDGPEEWCLELSAPANKVPKLSFEKSGITFFKGEFPYFPNRSRFGQNLRDQMAEHLNSKIRLPGQDLEVPEGTYQNLEDYYPFTNDFPLVYGIGQDGLPLNATDDRKARSRQFKGFLLFMEQILANYLSQLANVRELFTWTEADDSEAVVPTYYAQVLKEIQGIEDLYFDHAGLGERLGGLLETNEERLDRRNRFLDHLLARFAEEMTEYGLILYSKRLSISREEGLAAKEELLRDKARFLRDYPALSRDRGKGFDMLKNDGGNPPVYELWDTEDNVPGYQKRISRALGIDQFGRRDLSIYNFTIGSTLVEEPPASNNFVTRWSYRLNCRVFIAGMAHEHQLTAGILQESEYLAERAFEYDLRRFPEADWVPDPDANPDLDGKWGFRAEITVGPDTRVLARSTPLDTQDERDHMMYTVRWFLTAMQECLPLELSVDLSIHPPGEWTFQLACQLQLQSGPVAFTLSPPGSWPTREEAFGFAVDLVRGIGQEFRFHPVSYTISMVTVYAVEVRDEEGTLLATSNPFPDEAQRDEALAGGKLFFRKKNHCDARGVHVIEHLLLRPRRENPFPERLLTNCVHCPGDTGGDPAAPDIIVTKALTNSNQGPPEYHPPASNEQLSITELLLEEELVTIANNSGQTVDLTGYALWSLTGLQVFHFPPGYKLAAGAEVRVVSGKNADNVANGSSILRWTKRHVWQNEGDQVYLVSPERKMISQYPAPTSRIRTLTETNPRLYIQRLNLEEEWVRVVNESGSDQDMTGWYVESITGRQLFAFPGNYVLEDGKSVQILSGKNADPTAITRSQLFWTRRNVWRNEGDQAVLIGPNGMVVDTGPNPDNPDQINYFVKVETSEQELLLVSELFAIRNERDVRHLELFEFGASFGNYEIFEKETHRFNLKVGPAKNERVLLSAPVGYAKTEDEALADIQLLVNYFQYFANPDNPGASGNETGVLGACHYENDPYSFRLTVLLPGWVEEFGDPDFRRFAERKIRMETPVHIWAKICWINRWQMRQFENRWKNWLFANAAYLQGEPVNRLQLLHHGDAPIGLEIYRDQALSEPLHGPINLAPETPLLITANAYSPPVMGEVIYLLLNPGPNQVVRKLSTMYTGVRDGDFEVTGNEPFVATSEITLKYHGINPIKAEFFNDAALSRSIAAFGTVEQYSEVVIDAGNLEKGMFEEEIFLVVDDDTVNPIGFLSTSSSASAGDFQVTEIVPHYTWQLRELVDMMADFRNVYPVGSRLHDCHGEDDGSKIILGNSTLGNY